jgi:hypothetical protein
MSTPRIPVRALALVVAAGGAALFAPTPTSAQECATSAIANGCPFRCLTALNGQTTPIGESICDAIDNLASVAADLGSQASAFSQQAEQDMNALVQVALADAVNPTAIQQYNSAVQKAEVIEGRITDLLADPVCGSEAALNALGQFFTDQANNLIAAGQIAGATGQAVAALQPALAEVASIMSQLQQIAGLVQNASPEAQKQYEILTKAMEKLNTQLQELAALDVVGTATAGAEMVGSVGPFMVNCTGCASALASAVSSLTTGTASAGVGGAGCPASVEAAGGSCWAILGFPAGLTISTLTGALASQPCAGALEGVGDMADYVAKIGTFVSTSVKLTQGIAQSIVTIGEASNALVVLAQELGSDAQPQIESIVASLNVTANTINNSANIVATQVAPEVSQLAGNVVQQIGTNVAQLATCYNMLHGVAGAIAGDVLAGVNDLVLATSHLVDGGQVVTNLATQGQAAVVAAANHASTGWSDLAAERNRIHQELWNVSWPTIPPPTAGTLAHLANFANPTYSPSLPTLVSDMVDLEKDQVELVSDAVHEGKEAFLDAESSSDDARAQFDLAGGLSQSALTKLNTPGKLTVARMPVPSTGKYASLPSVKLTDVATRAPTTTVTVADPKDRLKETLRDVRELELVLRGPDGRPVQPGTACKTCPAEFGVRDVWASLDRARVRDDVTIRVYRGRTLVADLGTHASRSGSWTSMPAYLTPGRGATVEPTAGCDYRLVVAGARGATLAETSTCLSQK